MAAAAASSTSSSSTSSSASAALLLVCLHLLTVESAAEQALLSQRRPHITGCVSTNMETFHCRWDVGTFRNVSTPGDLRLFYVTIKPHPASCSNWSECPHYSTQRPNECFFNEKHTSVWTKYHVQLRSRDQTVVYEENRFSVDDIVQPDPPTNLNWTLLNASVTGLYYDVMLSWRPPQSADVGMGWMKLQYEVQYRGVSSDLWETADLVTTTQRSLFGLQASVNHEVRVRCKMLGGKEFGDFSDSVFIHKQSNVARFPTVALLILGALCLVAILMLVVVSQQNKLMVILLPPVPGPKIRGIDPELLKKGKLRELTSILGGPPDLRPELYNNDPWVEFIDLDIEEQNDRLTDLDTDCLTDRSLSSNCSPLSLAFRDDDSGRASCCEPDLPSDPEASPFHPLVPNAALSKDPTLHPTASESNSLGNSSEVPPAVAPGREALYAQVSEVRSSGKVLLSPEEEAEVVKDIMEEKKKEKKELKLLVVNADHQDYTSELSTSKGNPKVPAGHLREPCQTGAEPGTVPPPPPYCVSDLVPVSPLPPAPVYTVVEGVDRQNSFLLTPHLAPAPHLVIPKTMPTPDGYLTPDLLGSITP